MTRVKSVSFSSRIVTSTVTLALILSSVAEAQPGGAPAAGEQINEEEIAKDANTEINVKNADISAIVRIFSRKTKRNYILDEKVRGKVSIYLPGKVSSEESLRILDSVLALKGFTSVPIGENLWKIVPSKEARQSTIPTLTEDSSGQPTAAMVTRLVNLKYVAAEDVQQILSQLISGDGLINAYTGTNSLIIIDGEDNIDRLVKLVNELDVPSSNREMTIVPIKFADVKDIAEKLNDILGEGSKKEGSGGASDLLRGRTPDPTQFMAGGAVPVGGAPGRVGTSGKTVSARGREPKILADERTNSIIVVADEDTTARVRALISELDSKVDLSGSKFYVYRCQHATADQLAQVLAGLVGGGAGGATGGGTGFGGGARAGGAFGGGGFGGGGAFGNNGGLSNSSFGGGGGAFGDGGGLGGGLGGGGGAFGGGGGFGGGRAGGQQRNPTTAQLGPNISITSDPSTNSLIIAASKVDYEKIKGLLGQLDVKRRQVLVEATLLEVSIDNSIRTSTGFLSSGGGADGGALVRSDFAGAGGSLQSLFTNPSALQGFTLAAASAGSLKLPGITLPTQSILVSAAQSNRNVNVLSSPTILGTDNEEAQIIVGQNVPFLASTSTNQVNLNNTFNQISREDVGITLRIIPHISSRDYVTLQMFTEVSALDAATVNSQLGPTTRKRQTQNTIIAKDGQMIVTGGLISDDVSESDDGVPYLKDIPVLGHAFKANSQARNQKNLLVFLTPRIVKDQFDARDITMEGRDQMQDVIVKYEVEPRRDAVLKRESIDRVAETGDTYTGEKPGTIRPPKRAAARNNPAVADDGTIVLDGSSSGVIDLAPALPKESEGSGDAPMDVSEQKITVQDDAELGFTEITEPTSATQQLGGQQPTKAVQGAAVEAATGPQYLVLRLTNKSDAQKELPFLLGNSSQVVGIVIPPESSVEAKRFFQSNGGYNYTWAGQDIPVKVVGGYGSIPEASKVHPGMSGGWYTLSPYEIMNLGRGPWTRR